MQNLVKLIKLLAKYPGSTAVGLTAIMVSDIVQLAQPSITKFVVDRLEAQTINKTELYLWGAAMIALAVTAYAAKQVWRHTILGAAKKIENELRRRLLDKTLSLYLKEAQNLESGKFMPGVGVRRYLVLRLALYHHRGLQPYVSPLAHAYRLHLGTLPYLGRTYDAKPSGSIQPLRSSAKEP